MRRCKRCNSIWVCWNWLDMTSKESVNPNQEWLHECWNCAATELTNGPVKDGVPYWLLKNVGKHLVDNQLFEKNMAEDLQNASDFINDAPWDDEK